MSSPPETALSVAVRNDDIELVRKYLDEGTVINPELDLDALSKLRSPTALHVAAEKGNIDMINLLLNNNAIPDVKGHNGTALHVAALNGHLEVAARLLECGTNVNSTSESGYTPLHMAASGNHVEVILFLLTKGANINSNTELGGTPLHSAAERGHENAVKVLLKSKDIDMDVNVITMWYSGTPLHHAALFGWAKVAERLLIAGACVDIPDNKFGDTPLHDAAMGKHLDAVKILLEYGADVNARNKDGCTPLHHAVYGLLTSYKVIINNDPVETVDVLLNYGADVNAVNNKGQTPLQLNKLTILMNRFKGRLNFQESARIIEERMK